MSNYVQGLNQALQQEPVLDGFEHPGELILKEAFDSDSETATRWVWNYILDRSHPSTAADVLRLLCRFKPAAPVWRCQIVTAALQSDFVEVRDAAIQAIESWSEPDLVNALRSHSDAVPWLADYAAQVLRDLESISLDRTMPLESLPRGDLALTNKPIESLRQEVNRLFDDFHRGYFRLPFGRTLFDAGPSWRGETAFGAVPAVDLVENDDAFRLTAELPEFSEKDIDVSVAGGVLTINGERQEEKEDKSENYYVSERRHGSFRRSFGVPDSVEADKIEASFKNGVLTITLPKRHESIKTDRKITLKKA